MKKKLVCQHCGKEIKKGKYCNQKCYNEEKKLRGGKQNNLLHTLSNENFCVQCHKRMDVNRISAYCEECEMHIEETYEVLHY